MKKNHVLAGVVLAAAQLATLPAAAGPMSSGLAHTEDVARRAAAARATTFQVAAANGSCAAGAAAALQSHKDVQGVAANGSTLEVRLRDPAARATADREVAAAVAQACQRPPGQEP